MYEMKTSYLILRVRDFKTLNLSIVGEATIQQLLSKNCCIVLSWICDGAWTNNAY